ncbi:hypothetical protein GCM10010912_61640 [Paenibacillus albidus]|uniref:Uncharacterized protein n=1 Tax=Paenibacillus albidus TaxID=2041023 RepID=A0A917FWL0_9BACL|nr:hypothetical protein GCM10010912_61640 [Paenibacillus albidus]
MTYSDPKTATIVGRQECDPYTDLLKDRTKVIQKGKCQGNFNILYGSKYSSNSANRWDCSMIPRIPLR